MCEHNTEPAPRRVSSAYRIPVALHERLTAAAAEHGVSANWILTRALEDYLDRLLPANEVRLTR